MMRYKIGIRTYVAWLTAMPLLLVLIGLEAFLLHDRFSEMDQALVTQGKMIARQLAGSSEYGVFSNNRTFLKDIAENTLQQADVKAVVVLNAASNLLVTAESPPRAPSQNREVMNAKFSTLATLANHSTASLLNTVNNKRQISDNGKSMWIYQPILTTPVALDDYQNESGIKQVGAVIIEMSHEQTRRQKSRLLWLTITATLVSLLIALYLARLASRHITIPIREMSVAISAIGEGKLETKLATSSKINELHTLSRGINQMASDLRIEHAILQHRIDEATEQLKTLAFYDTLTLLPNRRLLNDRLGHALASSQRSGHYGALMFLDLDNFKPLNDQYGHGVGDLLLIEVSSRIARCLREEDTVARFGGDEFVVMLGELGQDREASAAQAHKVAEKIRTRLAAPYHLSYQQDKQPAVTIEHHCSTSIGVLLFIGHQVSQERILDLADAAMYQAKKNGRNQIFFDPNI